MVLPLLIVGGVAIGAGVLGFSLFDSNRTTRGFQNVAQSAIDSGLVTDASQIDAILEDNTSGGSITRNLGENFIGDGYGGFSAIKLALYGGAAFVALKALQEGVKLVK